MARFFFFDTETTDLLEKHPHIVQLGLLLTSGGREVASFHTLIDPEGQWEVPEQSTRVHGITTEMCLDTGIPIRDALMVFEQFAYMAGRLVAHNYEFDSAVIDLELKRLGRQGNYYNDVRQLCTMKAATPICQIPFASGGRGNKKFKYPKLNEAYRHFTKHEMQDAHTAYGDVRACRTVFQYLQNAGASDMWS
jgi:DNA polymerase-3 subunit epsilon